MKLIDDFKKKYGEGTAADLDYGKLFIIGLFNLYRIFLNKKGFTISKKCDIIYLTKLKEISVTVARLVPTQ